MATLSADVTKQMVNWIDSKVREGLYKSRSEVIRELVRERIEGEAYSKSALSHAALKKIWGNREDDVWASYV